VSTTDDKNYLGVQISGLSASLIGLESVLEFHASGVNVKVNKATDTDNNVGTVPAKLDWDSLTTSGMTLAAAGRRQRTGRACGRHGRAECAERRAGGQGFLRSGSGPGQHDGPEQWRQLHQCQRRVADADRRLFVGTGGSLSSATATANVVNGNLGFAGTVTTLKVVSIKDTNNGSVSTTDDKNYLGVQISGLSADLIGLESILEFHAGGVNVKVNKATDTDNNVPPSRPSWIGTACTTSGMTLASLVVDSALDVHADGTVALNALSGVLVASGSFRAWTWARSARRRRATA
jgi:hypothetical protein